MISLPNPTAKMTQTTEMIIYTCEGHGCAYSIDDEGTLYYTPISQSGAIRLDDWTECEAVDELDEEGLIEIQDKLILLNKANGTYFSGPLKVS